MHSPALAVCARLADPILVQPFGRRILAAVVAYLKPLHPRLSGAFEKRRERIPQGGLRQSPPLDQADAPRSDGELERRLPHPSELGDHHARLRQHDDDFRRIATDKSHRAVRIDLLIDRCGQLRTEKRDELFVPFRCG